MARGATSPASAADRARAEDGRSATPHQRDRKQQVLTQGTASVVRSITDAVVVKHGEPFFLCPPDGSLAIGERHGFGLYHHDTRYLSGYRLTLGGRELTPLAATAVEGTRAVFQMSNPELRLPEGTVAREGLDVRWTREVDRALPGLREAIRLRNLSLTEVRAPMRIELAADFEDVFAIRGLLDIRPGTLHEPRWRDGTLVFAYDGADGIARRLEVSFDPAPDATDATGARFDVQLAAREAATVAVTHRIVEEARGEAPPIQREGTSEPRHHARPGAGADTDDWIGAEDWSAAVRTDSLSLGRVLRRSLDDLVLLRSRLDGHAYYEAGIPWFATLFGRDALVTALQALAFDTVTAAESLRLLASRQGEAEREWRDESPGKILHELRIGELARIGEIPHTPYYGTIDATPLFLVLLARHAAWTGSTALFEELRGPVERALAWLDRTEDEHDGWLAYDSTTEQGLVNQGWKDSGNAIVMADGSIAEPPIALAEVQGYAYRARLDLAGLFEHTGDARRAAVLRDRAERSRARFEAAFWSDALGCYVLALVRDGGRSEVVTSNAGQVLWSGIASPERARRVARRLLAEDAFGGWGIRTLSSEARAYTPIGYHLGTVWPHDNALIAEGLRRYGLAEEAERLFVALVEAAADFPHERLPECFAGYARETYGIPVRYPVACHPQAWAAGTVPHLLTGALGLVPEGLDGRLRVVAPRLPPFVASLELRDLEVAGSRAHLRFERDREGRTRTDVVAVSGDLEVLVDDAASRSWAGDGAA